MSILRGAARAVPICCVLMVFVCGDTRDAFPEEQPLAVKPSIDDLPVIFDRMMGIMLQRTHNADEKEQRLDRISRELPALFVLAQQHPVEFVEQLFQFKVSTEVEGYEVVLLAFRVAGINEKDILEALLPHLNEREPHSKIASRLLSVAEWSGMRGPPSFGFYKEYLQQALRNNGDIEPHVIVRMFLLDPQQALEVCLDVYVQDKERQKPIRWSIKLVTDTLWKQEHGFTDKSEVEPITVQAITDLSNSEEWWVRLYICLLGHQHGTLVPPEIRVRLRQDPHPIIQAILKGTTE